MVRATLSCLAVLVLGVTSMACTATPSVADAPPEPDNNVPVEKPKPDPDPSIPEPDPCAAPVACPEAAPAHDAPCGVCVSTTPCIYADEAACKLEQPATYASCDGKHWVVEQAACPPTS